MTALSFYFKLELFMLFYVKYKHIKNNIIYFHSFNDISLALTLLFYLILTCIS